MTENQFFCLTAVICAARQVSRWVAVAVWVFYVVVAWARM